MPVAFAITVCGRVQGVGYRAHALRTADALRIAGWVANRRDGTVAVEATGVPEDLEAFVAALRAGPPGAEVTDVRVTRINPERVSGATFEIRT